MRNKLFSLRLSDEVITELQKKFPDKSTVESVRACIEQVLCENELDIIGSINSILEDVYTRIEKLEQRK
jgi:hypothetical protein